ncbi:hypothetical protein ABT294_02750 [Nonomuraea sp. NPDC000554]|uniref:hypothetical protein n=1 Tax=Nonomuraea sp. NPDC000554 TaxID=3154259 RepID=UPI003322D690
MTATTAHQVTFRVTREPTVDTGEPVWVAGPVGHTIGCVSAFTLADLHEEAEAIKHFVLDLPTSETITVEYDYQLDAEATEALNRYLEAARLRAQYPARSQRAAQVLGSAGVSDADTAILLGLSAKRVQQLRTAS